MSNWIEILLTASALEETGQDGGPEYYPAIEYINKMISPYSLFLIRNPNVREHSPTSCFAMATKSLNRTEFLAVLDGAPWQWKEQVQLFVREEDDKGFQEIDLNWRMPKARSEA